MNLEEREENRRDRRNKFENPPQEMFEKCSCGTEECQRQIETTEKWRKGYELILKLLLRDADEHKEEISYIDEHHEWRISRIMENNKPMTQGTRISGYRADR